MKNSSVFFKYAKLYRGDVAAVTFFSAMGGYLVSGKALDFSAFFKGAFISLVVYNFVYVLNAVTDIGEDMLNKPHRPLPSGDLTKKEAEKYLILLLFISVVLIPIMFKGTALFLMFLVIFLGIVYSSPPFQLKRYSFSAVFITAWGMTNPFLVTGGTDVFTAFTGITLTSLAVVIFKDISDEKGDRKAGRKIITDKLPLRFIFLFSVLFLVASVFVLFFSSYPALSAFPVFVMISVVFHILLISRKTIYKILYRNLIFSAIAGIVFSGGLVLFQRV